MQILQICFLAGTLGQGGAERQLFYYLKSLIENGHVPYVLCLTKGEFWEKPIRELGIPVIWVGQSSNRLIRLCLFIKEIRQKPTEIIHSQHFHTNLYAYFLGIIFHKKAIGSLRSDVFSELKSLGLLGKPSLHLPAKVVANSTVAIANAVTLKKPKSQLFYLPNVVDTKYFIPSTKRITEEIFHVIFVGSLLALKRVDRIIRVAKKCQEENLNIDFKLFGDGGNKHELVQLANELGVLNKNLQFMGNIADVRTAYHDADVLMLTSDYEGTPNVILEAMSCGLAILSTRVGDVANIIEDGVNGYLSNMEENEIFEKLCELYNNRELVNSMGKANREKMVKERSFQNLIINLEELYFNE